MGRSEARKSISAVSEEFDHYELSRILRPTKDNGDQQGYKLTCLRRQVVTAEAWVLASCADENLSHMAMIAIRDMNGATERLISISMAKSQRPTLL